MHIIFSHRRVPVEVAYWMIYGVVNAMTALWRYTRRCGYNASQLDGNTVLSGFDGVSNAIETARLRVFPLQRCVSTIDIDIHIMLNMVLTVDPPRPFPVYPVD